MSGLFEPIELEANGNNRQGTRSNARQSLLGRWLGYAVAAGVALFQGGFVQAADKPTRHVVVFTTSDYSKHSAFELPHLPGNDDEGRKFSELLGKSGKYNNRVHKFANASESELYRHLKQIKDELTENDELIVYLSGHGFENADEADGGVVIATVEPKEKWLQVSNLARALGTIQGPKKLLVVDSCRSFTSVAIGTMGEKVFGNTDITEPKEVSRKQEPVQMDWNLAVVYACQSGGASNISEGMSLFASALLKALAVEDGRDLLSVFDSMKDQVLRSSRKLKVSQVPELVRYIGNQHTENHVVSNWAIGQRDHSIAGEESRKLEDAESRAPERSLADAGRNLGGYRGQVVSGATRAEKVGTGLQVAGSIAGMAGAGRVGGYLGTAGTAIKAVGAIRRR